MVAYLILRRIYGIDGWLHFTKNLMDEITDPWEITCQEKGSITSKWSAEML